MRAVHNASQHCAQRRATDRAYSCPPRDRPRLLVPRAPADDDVGQHLQSPRGAQAGALRGRREAALKPRGVPASEHGDSNGRPTRTPNAHTQCAGHSNAQCTRALPFEQARWVAHAPNAPARRARTQRGSRPTRPPRRRAARRCRARGRRSHRAARCPAARPRPRTRGASARRPRRRCRSSTAGTRRSFARAAALRTKQRRWRPLSVSARAPPPRARAPLPTLYINSHHTPHHITLPHTRAPVGIVSTGTRAQRLSTVVATPLYRGVSSTRSARACRGHYDINKPARGNAYRHGRARLQRKVVAAREHVREADARVGHAARAELPPDVRLRVPCTRARAASARRRRRARAAARAHSGTGAATARRAVPRAACCTTRQACPRPASGAARNLQTRHRLQTAAGQGHSRPRRPRPRGRAARRCRSHRARAAAWMRAGAASARSRPAAWRPPRAPPPGLRATGT